MKSFELCCEEIVSKNPYDQYPLNVPSVIKKFKEVAKLYRKNIVSEVVKLARQGAGQDPDFKYTEAEILKKLKV